MLDHPFGGRDPELPQRTPTLLQPVGRQRRVRAGGLRLGSWAITWLSSGAAIVTSCSAWRSSSIAASSATPRAAPSSCSEPIRNGASAAT